MNVVEQIKEADSPQHRVKMSHSDWFKQSEVSQNSWPAWVHSLRQSGLAHFSEMGYPTPADEEWRFTPVNGIADLPFLPMLEAPRLKGLKIDLPNQEKGWPRLVFVDGHFAPGLSRWDGLGQGIRIGNLAGALRDGQWDLEPHLARHGRPMDNPFLALNTAFFTDGAVIGIDKGQTLDVPIQVLHLTVNPARGAASHVRNLVIAQPESKIVLIEEYINISGQACVTNAATEVVIGENASVEHCRIQNEGLENFHIGAVQASQEANSQYLNHSISMGARLARLNIGTAFRGENCLCTFNGLYLAGSDQLVDHHTVMDHAKPNCESHEYYHGILAGTGKAVFNGKIFVRKDAQKTNAKQNNRNLLLSDEATIDTKPQLEIFADDVKCTHGATVGQLQEEALFYLRSRGIGEKMARQILIHAFAKEVLERISLSEVQNQLDTKVMERLGELSPGAAI